MKRAILALCLTSIAGVVAAGAMAACSSSSGGNAATGGPDTGTGGDTGPGDAGGGGTFMPEIACTDTIDSVYADPGDVSSKPKGAILKCAKDKDMSAADLTAAVDVADDAGNRAYTGPAFTSGAHVYRILYRTTRGDPKSSPGYSSALLLLPETPRLGTGKPLPVILAAHGARGQTGKCAPSKDDPAAAFVEEDFQHLVYPFVGLGFPVIAPDLAGYANFGGANNPPPAFDDLNDVGRSMLDGARAIRGVIPSSLTQQVVIIGHSQGSYNAMAALALADSYGLDGIVSAVAVYSPIWASQRGWAAIFAEPSTYTFAASSLGSVSIWYHYTHSFLLDGPDKALELFDPTKAATVQAFVNNDCWSKSYPDLEEAGTSANDLFSSTYRQAITYAAIPAPLGGGGNCPTKLCTTWIDRMTADYPHFTGGATKVPMLVWYSNNDTTLTPDLAQCVFNRLSGDKLDYQLCYDTSPVGHGGVVAENAGYVVDWVAHETLPDAGAPAMGNCSALANNDAGVPQLVTPDGGAQLCNPIVSTQ